MLTVLIHTGLGLLLTLAPALCCCNLGRFTGRAAVAPPVPAAPAPRPVPACPHGCHAEQPADAPAAPAPQPAPAGPHCVFCDGQASALPTDPPPRPDAPAFAGAWLPVLGLLAAVAPAHPAHRAGADPPERAGVDARSAALFERHVLRC